MAFNVNEFRTRMVGDGARPNLFKCEIPALGSFINTSGSTNAIDKFSFMCRAAQLPGSTVNQIPVNYFGRELKFSGNRTFTEWTVTIINDEDFLIRNAFEIWMSQLNSHVGNTRAIGRVNPDSYQKDAIITQYGKANIEGEAGIKKYKFIGLFPIDLSPIEMDWGANDTIEEFAVTFAYQWWESFESGVRTTDDVNNPNSLNNTITV
jgi:hypothetical protein